MAWYMDLLFVLAGGVLAIAAAASAQRLMHVWDVKQSHRDDLVAEAVRPWMKETDRLLEFVRHGNLRGYVRVSPNAGGYAFRISHPGTHRPFPENWPIWERARDHWSHLGVAWDDLEERQASLDNRVTNLVSNLALQLPDPPGGLAWEYELEGDPFFGKRWTATELWRMYWESQQQPNDAWKRFEQDAAKAKWLKSKNQPLSQTLAELARNFFYGQDGQAELERSKGDASRIEGGLLEFKQELLRVAYDKNLAGDCVYCPRFFAWARSARKQSTQARTR